MESSELLQALKDMGKYVSEKDVEKMFSNVNLNNDGVIDW